MTKRPVSHLFSSQKTCSRPYPRRALPWPMKASMKERLCSVDAEGHPDERKPSARLFNYQGRLRNDGGCSNPSLADACHWHASYKKSGISRPERVTGLP
ncbi:MAG: hypothetical protein MZV63_31705 [Marinilabiliales bacterium]|nr:hypothetical protein [Marinilabiliales bacterium]